MTLLSIAVERDLDGSEFRVLTPDQRLPFSPSSRFNQVTPHTFSVGRVANQTHASGCGDVPRTLPVFQDSVV